MPEKISAESMLKGIEERLNALEDNETITQLDIVNLKNEIEKLRMMSPSPLTPEEEERVVELKNLSRHADTFKKWVQTVNEVRLLRSEIGSIDVRKAKEMADLLRERSEQIEKGKPFLEGFKKDITRQIEELKETVDKKILNVKPLKDLEKLRTDVSQNKKSIGDVRKTLIGMPLEGMMGDYKNFRSVLDSNRKVIAKLEKRISMLPKARAEKTEKPEELEGIKNRISDLNDRINLLDKKVKIQASLKPISMPESLEVPQVGEDIEKKLELLRGEMENVIRRMEKDEDFMGSFVRKEELESLKRGQRAFDLLGALRGRGKAEAADEADVSRILGRLAISENKINRIFSDLQDIKEDLKTRRLPEKPVIPTARQREIDDLKNKMDELELKFSTARGKGPVVIE